MYAKSNNYVTFFKDEKNENTEKLVYGRVSESIKTGRQGAGGKDEYEYESWNARFVGKAYDKAKELADKTFIKLTEWSVRNPYVKEKKRSYPYILVMDFEIHERGGKGNAGSGLEENEEGFVTVADGDEPPFN